MPEGWAACGRRGGRGRRRSPGRALLAGAGALAAIAAVVAASARLADGPLGPLPGGRLRGPEAPFPDDWRFAAAASEIEVELATGGPLGPRSVTTWLVVHDGALFVTADFLTPWKRWPRQALARPRARVRVAGRIVPVRLVRVVERERVLALRRALGRKYGLADDSWLANVRVWFFELRPRFG